jgi:hypothetical protein
MISSGHSHVGQRRADIVRDPVQPSEFEVFVMRATAIGPLIQAAWPDARATWSRQRIDDVFELAKDAIETPSDRPRFVFAHVPAPHPPVVYDARGNAAPLTPDVSIARVSAPAAAAGRAERTTLMLGQTTYIADRTLRLLDGLSLRDGRETVLFVFSDHGSDVGFDPEDPLASDLDERTSSLIALRTPGRRGLLPPGTTTTAVLPHVLNEYLASDLPIPGNGLWAWTAGGSTLDFVPIDPQSFE